MQGEDKFPLRLRLVGLGRIDIQRIQMMDEAMWMKARKCVARRS